MSPSAARQLPEATLTADELRRIDAYWRACNYLSAGMIYLRDNPAGPNDELWYHASGCRSWLRVTRHTQTHEILAAAFAGMAVR